MKGWETDLQKWIESPTRESVKHVFHRTFETQFIQGHTLFFQVGTDGLYCSTLFAPFFGKTEIEERTKARYITTNGPTVFHGAKHMDGKLTLIRTFGGCFHNTFGDELFVVLIGSGFIDHLADILLF